MSEQIVGELHQRLRSSHHHMVPYGCGEGKVILLRPGMLVVVVLIVLSRRNRGPHP